MGQTIRKAFVGNQARRLDPTREIIPPGATRRPPHFQFPRTTRRDSQSRLQADRRERHHHTKEELSFLPTPPTIPTHHKPW